ncbi:aldo/keto reductase [Ulvibacterium sp.]|uniref:aldo/keto reductase n=1 Tax=Ulvibacterium sp. TaxID=2665914 RepID=UPI00260671D1|nr:aldo/keto reductase [Ulvibacterium sp.]
MNYRNIPKTDLKVSEICLGTWAMGNDFWGDVDDNASIKTIQAALDSGINFIDTAPAYGAGHAESVVGQAIKGNRDKIILGTKTGVTRTSDSFLRDLRPETILREIDESLSRLGTDYIDLYQIHWPDVNTPLEDSLETLLKLQEQGKFRYLGVSNFTVELMEQAKDLVNIVSLQPNYSMLQRKIEETLVPYCVKNEVGLVTYGTLSGGLLTGKYRELPNFEENDNRSRFYNYYRPEIWPQIQGLLSLLDVLAEKHECPVSYIAIAWALQKPGIVSVLVGAKNEGQVISNAAASNIRLTKDEVLEIDRYIRKELGDVAF